MRYAFLCGCAVLGAVASSSFAALNVADPSLINLYQFNEATSGDLTNGTPGSFLDTAPTGTPQNHDDLSASPPTWTSGLPVGDGIGLTFNRSEVDYTRFAAWMNTPQGNYANGKSFSVMVRLNAASFADNNTYDVIGIGSHHISLAGSGEANTAVVGVNVRDQDTHFTLDSNGTTTGSSSSGTAFKLHTNTWSNLFLIYNANSSLTVALDDGTNFYSQTATGVPSGFDTLTEGFDNATVPWFVGSLGSGVNTFDGTIESIAIWDKALTPAEADAINLTTTSGVPEPAATSVLLLGAAAAALRRRRRS
jgi:hypothetical protein